LPAATPSPDFCADSMRLPASSIRLAIAAIDEPSIVTVAPSGVLICTLAPAPGTVVPPRLAMLAPIGPRPTTSETTPAMTIIATKAQTITTAV
jgi:hypothetical protein